MYVTRKRGKEMDLDTLIDRLVEIRKEIGHGSKQIDIGRGQSLEQLRPELLLHVFDKPGPNGFLGFWKIGEVDV